MNKKILAAILAVVVLFIAHTTFWVYQSGKIKSALEQVAGRISKEIGGKSTELFFTDSKVSGYPFHFTIQFNQPKITSTGGGEKFELSTHDEQLIVTANLLGSHYKVKLPSKVDVSNSTEGKQTDYKLEFNKESPEVALSFSKYILFSKKFDDLVEYLNENLDSFKYADSGYSLNKSDDGLKVASSDKDYVYVSQTKSKPNKIATAYDIKVENMDNAALFSGSSNAQGGFWPITASINLSSIDEQDESGKSKSVDFVLRNIDVTAASFGFGIKGDIQASGEDIFPFGNLSIKLTSYQNLVDYFSGTVKNYLAETKIPFFNIKSEKSIDFKKVLYEIATEKSNEDKDILLSLNREKGKSLFIGQKGLMEVIDLLKTSDVPVADPKKDLLSPKSDAPLNNSAPVSGLPAEPQKTK